MDLEIIVKTVPAVLSAKAPTEDGPHSLRQHLPPRWEAEKTLSLATLIDPAKFDVACVVSLSALGGLLKTGVAAGAKTQDALAARARPCGNSPGVDQAHRRQRPDLARFHVPGDPPAAWPNAASQRRRAFRLTFPRVNYRTCPRSRRRHRQLKGQDDC